jgi:hypothetical protein
MRTTITIDDDLLKWVKLSAELANESASSYIEQVLLQSMINDKDRADTQKEAIELMADIRRTVNSENSKFRTEEEVAEFITNERRKKESWRKQIPKSGN